MEPLFAFSTWHYLYSIPLSIISIFLILVILVQRGRGGGLTGALGGMGGQSAFGTKAGDLFTKITIVVAAIWILLAMLTIQRLARPTVAKPAKEKPPGQVEKDIDQKGTGDKGSAPENKKTDAGKGTGNTSGTAGGDKAGSDSQPPAAAAGKSDKTTND
jgi:preprotein translocase subunit SecG